MENSEGTAGEWPSAEDKATSIAKARALRPQAEKGGLRRELLSRRLRSAMDDPRPAIRLEEVVKELKARIPLPEPAEWVK